MSVGWNTSMPGHWLGPVFVLVRPAAFARATPTSLQAVSLRLGESCFLPVGTVLSRMWYYTKIHSLPVSADSGQTPGSAASVC